MSSLVDVIGTEAMLEQTAEESNELGFACLKLARLLRGENKVYGRNQKELVDNVEEELADIVVCATELAAGGCISCKNIQKWIKKKKNRMKKRLQEEGE